VKAMEMFLRWRTSPFINGHRLEDSFLGAWAIRSHSFGYGTSTALVKGANERGRPHFRLPIQHRFAHPLHQIPQRHHEHGHAIIRSDQFLLGGLLYNRAARPLHRSPSSQ